MLQPATRDPKYTDKKRVSIPYNLPAPTGGLNARDAYTGMDARDAITLTNLFPEANYVVARGGWASWRSGQTNASRSLLTWNGGSGTDKLFLGAGTSIYDVTSSGSSATAVQTGLSGTDWQWTNFENSGGSIFLCCVNGVDSYRTYDGTNWVTQSITGATSSTFANVIQFKYRLWFSVVNSLTVYFLGTGAISGAATAFSLASVFRRGGYVIGLGTFSADAGDGPNEYLCFVTSNGEVAVYEGTDPTNSNAWALIGRYDIGLPIGRRCCVRWNGDLGILTEDGLISMQAALQFGRESDQKAAITAKIQTLFSTYASTYKLNFGWMMQLFPKQRYLIVNIPQIENQAQIQLVMNTITGAWCSFSNMNAGTWGVANNQLFFGGNDGVVYQANVGYQDNGANIQWEMQTSWQMPGGNLSAVWQLQGGVTNKMFKAIRPNLFVGAGVTYAVGIDTDFMVKTPVGQLAALSTGTASMTWSWTWPGTWGGQTILDQRWQSAGSIGTWTSAHMVGTTSQGAFQCNGFQILAESGGPY